MKTFFLIIYYGLAQFIPMKPLPGYQVGYALRRFLAKRLLQSCGKHVVIKSGCYFGDGSRLQLGDFSQLGLHGRYNGQIEIGRYVLVSPDVVMMATSHEYSEVSIPIMLQGEATERPIRIGDGTWIGTRAIILPGVEVGEHSIVAAGSVVTRSFPDFSIIGGVPAKLIKRRTGYEQVAQHVETS